MSENESPHITALRKQDKLNRLVKKKLRVASGAVEAYEASPLTHDLGVAAAIAAEKRIASAEPGELIEGRGIFAGTWTLKDADGNSLTQTFNVFAAPEDLPDVATYEDTVKHVAGLRGWHGYDGAGYADDSALYEALKKGKYEGGWIIPPREILYGKDDSNTITHFDSLSRHSNKGAFRDRYSNKACDDDSLSFPGWYWSSTEVADAPDSVWVFRMTGSDHSCITKNSGRASCRPVRLEPKP